MTPESPFAFATLRDLTEPDLATRYLGHKLAGGELFLLLGAGISDGVGLPSWKELVARCEEFGGVSSPDDAASRSPDELMKAIESLRRLVTKSSGDSAFAEIVHRALYAELSTSDRYPDEIIGLPLLSALGALIMSLARDGVADVFTLNFDDVLENYVRIHGFRPQVVSEFPCDLRKDVDLQVFHLHGYLPPTRDFGLPTTWLVLSHREFLERVADEPSRPWPTLLGSRLMSGVMLAVGTSMNDLDVQASIWRARKVVADKRPMGFVLVDEATDDERERLLEDGIVPVEVGSHEAIPHLLLRICQGAATIRH